MENVGLAHGKCSIAVLPRRIAEHDVVMQARVGVGHGRFAIVKLGVGQSSILSAGD